MIIRKSEYADVATIMAIYARAKAFMAEQGNPDQWNDEYPMEDLIRYDIERGVSFVCDDNGKVAATFAFIIGDEPSYQLIEEGAWHYDQPYGTIHRLASSGEAKGIFKACFDFCKSQINYLRADTHHNNKVMLSLLPKYGFVKCGRIYVLDGTPRIAFDLLLPDDNSQSEFNDNLTSD